LYITDFTFIDHANANYSEQSEADDDHVLRIGKLKTIKQLCYI